MRSREWLRGVGSRPGHTGAVISWMPRDDDFPPMLTWLPLLGGSVVYAATSVPERENLIRPQPPVFAGQDDSGTRQDIRRGSPAATRSGHDERGSGAGAHRNRGAAFVVDTSYFTGNYPPFISVEATSVQGYPAPNELTATAWEILVAKTTAMGDARNHDLVDSDRRWTHVRLSIYPDGGVARFRVHGEVVADPRFIGETSTCSVENGGSIVDCSDMYYSCRSI